MDIETIVTPGLGNATHLIATGDGGAIVVDPPRDAWRIEAAAAARGWRISHALETHVHNDYLSGVLELRASSGTEIVAPARGHYAFDHRPADEGVVLEIGALRVTARATPGHTPEHLAWEFGPLDVGADGAPLAVATGGSLLVGSAGRTDLLGPQRVEELTAAQFRSFGYLASLAGSVRLLPTHGTGSFCSAGPGAGRRTTTVADELRTNPLLAITALPAFRSALLDRAGPYPTYYREMAAINQAGPRVLGGLPPVADLDAAALAAAVADGARIVDGRPRHAFAAAHIPGSLNVEVADDAFAAYVGWHVPFGSTLALILPDDVPSDRPATELLRIGYDRLAGVLEGGLDAWQATGRSIARYPVIAPSDAAEGEGEVLLDVRDPNEWRDDGTVDGAMRIPLWELRERLDEVPRDRLVTVLCRSGRRASIAASILDAAGRDVRVVAQGGAKEIRAAG